MFPCEYAARHVLPALRRQIVLELRRRGKSVSEIARMLHMTPAAVSQYLKGKRGREFVGVSVERVVDALLHGEEYQPILCEICREVTARVRSA